jgi:hypothetical protein
MLLKLATLGSLAFVALAPAAAFADHERDQRGRDDKRAADFCEDGSRVWVAGHFEVRDVQRVIPAVTRQEWVPDRVETVCIPAVTERVCIPAVTERVYCPAVTERRWVADRGRGDFVPGRYDVGLDSRGGQVRFWLGAHYEDRSRGGHYENVVVRPAHYETRIVSPERHEVRIVVPERHETRVVERGHYRTCVVRPERVECVKERVWVPGHFETRGRGFGRSL